jgi:carbamoyltransferase
MYTLGINAAFHDSAAALIKDGVLITAAEDERFTHIKHGKRPVPFTAWEDREDFRPVEPVVMEELAGEWFENATVSPFMLFVYNIKPNKADKIPAVKHVDGTARIQTINRQQHLLYYDLLHEFKKLTGIPVLINTSFNTRGEPIVCTPKDAIACFWTSPFDALVINSFLLEKNGVA